MQSFVLLAVAAVWLAVIVPPLLRSRVENRPNSSVTDFRRQLSTLQRAVPTRTMSPMRGMARQLAQAPQQRSPQQRSQQQRAHTNHGGPGELRRSAVLDQHYRDETAGHSRPRMHEGSLQRRQSTAAHRPMRTQQVSPRELVRRRRSNTLFILVLTVGISAFLAATTKNSFMVFTFAISFVSLCGFCYRLVQMRNVDTNSAYSQQSWFNAA